MDKTLSLEEAAEQLKVSTATLRTYIKERKIKATRLDNHYRIAPEELRKLQKEHRS